MVQIAEANSNRDVKKFIQFPFLLYKNNPYWVPDFVQSDFATLKKNPALEFCKTKYFLARKDGKIAGRIAGIINKRENEHTDKKLARFGWMDFTDDAEVSAALFQAVEQWASEEGMTAVHGPLGFTDFDREGLLIEGFDELGTLATIYNHPYYRKHFESNGYEKSTDWVEYEIEVPETVSDRVNGFAKRIAERYHLRELEARKAKDFKPYLPGIFKLLNEAYKNLYGFVPLTDGQVKFYSDQYFDFINPGFVSVILNEAGEVVGFGITMPSFSQALQKSKGRLFPFGFIHVLRAMKKNDRADFYLIAVHPDYQKKGVNALIFNKIWNSFIKFGIKKVETNPELETNTAVQAMWQDYHPRNHKRRRCFIKQLS
ncbi:MAG: GNAT family N-acetyltransferase [Saprospiraceae bacterium]